VPTFTGLKKNVLSFAFVKFLVFSLEQQIFTSHGQWTGVFPTD